MAGKSARCDMDRENIDVTHLCDSKDLNSPKFA